MAYVMFGLGVLTCLGCGRNVCIVPSDWKRELVWVSGGAIGALMMAVAMGIGGCQ